MIMTNFEAVNAIAEVFDAIFQFTEISMEKIPFFK